MIRQFIKQSRFGAIAETHSSLAIVNFAIVLLMFVLSGVMLLFLPEEIDILHNGDTTYPLPSVLAVWLLPVIALLLNIGFIVQRRLSAMNTMVFVILLVVMMSTYISYL